MATIADILMARARQAGESRRQQADVSGGMWRDLGGIIAQTGGAILRERQEAPMRAQDQRMRELQIREAEAAEQGRIGQAEEEQVIRSLFARPTAPTAEELISVAGPERGMALAKGLEALQPKPIESFQQVQQVLRDVLLGMDALPEGVRAEYYPAVRGSLVQRGIIKPEDAPEVYQPEWWAMTRQYGQEPKPPATPTLEQIDPTKDLYRDGQLLKPGVAPAEEEVSMAVRGPNGQKMRVMVPKSRLRQGGVEEYREPLTGSQPSYQSKEVLNDAGKAVVANYDSRTGVTTDVSTGQPIKNPRPVPSAMETQDARKFKQAEPILRSVSELSEKINTGQGLIAKMSGGVEKVKAQANYNDDVAEYEALISGFTPLVARALGHTGVLTQQDVDSVKALFPKPGDSKSLRDRKIMRIKSIIGELETGAGGGSGPQSGDILYDSNGTRIP